MRDRLSFVGLALAGAFLLFGYGTPKASASPVQREAPLACKSGRCWDGFFGGNCNTTCGCVLGDGSTNSNNSYCGTVQ